MAPPVKYRPQNSEQRKWSRRVKRAAVTHLAPLTMEGGVDTSLSVIGSVCLTSSDPRGWLSSNVTVLVLFRLFLPRTAANLKQASISDLSPPSSSPSLASASFMQALEQNHVFFLFFFSGYPVHSSHSGIAVKELGPQIESKGKSIKQ